MSMAVNQRDAGGPDHPQSHPSGPLETQGRGQRERGLPHRGSAMCTHGARKASAVRLRRLQVVQGSAAGQTLSPLRVSFLQKPPLANGPGVGGIAERISKQDINTVTGQACACGMPLRDASLRDALSPRQIRGQLEAAGRRLGALRGEGCRMLSPSFRGANFTLRATSLSVTILLRPRKLPGLKPEQKSQRLRLLHQACGRPGRGRLRPEPQRQLSSVWRQVWE